MSTNESFISQSVYTNTSSSNQTWLQAYKQAVKEATASDKAYERREHYSHPSQTYPDYLDYKEEWEYATDDMLSDVKKTYIYRMASSNQTMRCDCGEDHTLSLQSDEKPNTTIVDDPYILPWTTCWTKTIDRVFNEVKTLLQQGAVEFPSVISKNLSEIVQWKLAKTGRTPTLLPYDTYKEVWWNIDVDGGDTDLSVHIVSLMRQSAKRVLSERSQAARDPMVSRYFFNTEEIIGDHGFHLFMRTQENKEGEILKFLNKQRRAVGYYAKVFKTKEVAKAIQNCEKCNLTPYTTLSPFGVYCAPPGAGKTTAQNENLLVGFDTDWIGIGPNWRAFSPLLRKGIPIITNQINLFRDSGLKIQLLVKRAIRKDTHGKPMADYENICQIGRDFPDTYVLHMMSDKEFVSHRILTATALAHLCEVQKTLFINNQTIWNVSTQQRDFLNGFGRSMRDLAKGKVKEFYLEPDIPS